MKTRIIMFLIINLAIMTTFYVALFVLSMFGIDIAMYTTGSNGNIQLLIFAAIFGFGGSFISLFLSKFLVKRTMKIKIIKENEEKNKTEQWLYDFVSELSKQANIKMPEIGTYNGEANAFATGWNKNKALIAVSSGLLESMNKEEVEGVIAHEMAHITNGDMVTMTLLQGLLNTFVIYLARVIGNIIDKAIFKNDKGYGIGYYATVFALEMIFSVIATIILAKFSRYREFKADEGSVKYNGKEGIYNALEKLGQLKPAPLPAKIKAFGIVGFMGLFATHPPIEKRLENIKNFKE